MNTTTPKDGFYIYPAPITGAEIVAQWKDGQLASLSQSGEAQPVTPLTAAHVAHEVSYIEDVIFTPAATISRAQACDLHKALARAGVRDHYALASFVCGVPVRSLTDLCAQEARALLTYAQQQRRAHAA